MLGKLEKFQCDLGKKILNIPTHYSNLLAPSGCIKMARFQILQRELTFLWHTLHSTEITIYMSAFESLREKGCEPLLIQQCKFLYRVTIQKVFSQSSNNGQSPLSLKDITSTFGSKCQLERV